MKGDRKGKGLKEKGIGKWGVGKVYKGLLGINGLGGGTAGAYMVL